MIKLEVRCALCTQPLEAGLEDSSIFVRPCPDCQRKEVKKVFVELDPVDPDVVERYALKHSHARGYYIGRSKNGNFVRFGVLKKMDRYLRALEQDHENVLASPAASFKRCGHCGVMTTDGFVCTNCGEDDSVK